MRYAAVSWPFEWYLRDYNNKVYYGANPSRDATTIEYGLAREGVHGQVGLTGAASGEVLVTCNGFPVPLQPTAAAGVQVAGIRYRAWAPPSSLHPTIPPDSPTAATKRSPDSRPLP